MADSKDKKAEGRVSDLDKTGRVNTTVETQTQVVDNTDAPAERPHVEYEVHTSKLHGGTILHTVGEPVGGFPSEREDA